MLSRRPVIPQRKANRNLQFLDGSYTEAIRKRQSWKPKSSEWIVAGRNRRDHLSEAPLHQYPWIIDLRPIHEAPACLADLPELAFGL